ncbi:hypothetical protein AAVH_24312 [Aphelenchoides avenae]|nr:hypothetical protein AAVH_24312 [Aphelenchus avenae]
MEMGEPWLEGIAVDDQERSASPSVLVAQGGRETHDDFGYGALYEETADRIYVTNFHLGPEYISRTNDSTDRVFTLTLGQASRIYL